MGKKVALILSVEAREELERTVRSQTIEARIKDRCRIILRLSEGQSFSAIQRAMGVARSTVGKWKGRFLELGFEGLTDAKRSGRPVIYGMEAEARVVSLACSKGEDGFTGWTQRRIAAKCGMSQTTVFKMLERQALKPHKTEYWCGISPDVDFDEKLQDVVGLYLSPPENAIVLSIDEKTQIQALDRTQPELPIRSGSNRKVTATCKRNGVVNLIAALSVHDGSITAETIERNDSKTFLKFLKKLYRKFPKKHLHVVLDNLSVHKQADVRKWVESSKRITLHFTPTYSSWLNQIEIWVRIMSRDVLKDAVWHSVERLKSQHLQYIDTYNNTMAAPLI